VSSAVDRRLRIGAYAELIGRSPELEAATLTFTNAVATTLRDNKMPFFPAYTDHGIDHVERVLETAMRLTPDEVWPLLGPEDAAAMVCATALHDIALHVRETHVAALVASGPSPRPWFASASPDRSADRPWSELWSAFQAECRHMGSGRLEAILGPRHGGIPAVAFEPQLDPDDWTESDRLLIGEFIRRHHARIAHEIALHGWPGLTPDAFPVLSDLMPGLADAVGLIARSHNEDLRPILRYCEHVQPGNLRPWGVLVAFGMSLLRVADYLQIDADRAPPILLHLKAPMTQASLDEWNKHAAVARIGWEGKDPSAVYVTAGEQLTLRTYLHTRELLRAVQLELDVTSAVLGETYADERLRAVRLAYRRVISNFDEPAVAELLPFAPLEARLHTDPDLFRLVVSPLYGDRPTIAVRELVQNAVDAVRQLHRHDGATASSTEPEVIVEVEELPDERAVLRVTDHGIGMTADTVRDYYLAAGASLGPGPEDFEGVSVEQRVAWLKAGRFGIGVFAAFLLADEIRVRTRHAESDRGVAFVVSNDAELVELRWCEAPVGTSVELTIERARLERGHSITGRSWGGVLLHFISDFADYYRGTEPGATIRWRSPGIDQEIADRRRSSFLSRFDRKPKFPADVPSLGGDLSEEWAAVDVPGFDGVIWRMPSADAFTHAEVVHNGFALGSHWTWSDTRLAAVVHEPNVAIADSRHNLSFNLTRSEVFGSKLPFERELAASIGENLCRWLQSRPLRPHPLLKEWAKSFAVGAHGWAPLLPQVLASTGASHLYVLWDEDWRPVPRWHERFALDIDGDRLPWSAGELRAILPLDIHHGIPEEHMSYGYGEESAGPEDRMYAGVIGQSVRRLQWLTGWQPLGTIVRSWGLEHEDFSLRHNTMSGWVRDARSRGTSRPERQYVYRSEAARVDSRDKASLNTRLDRLAAGRGGIAALSLYTIDETDAVFDADLGVAWTRRIAGLMPHDQRATAALRDAYERARDQRALPRRPLRRRRR
jgi:Histidine kinase-, DNA gyrase B-, and HSP90-like ATPase